MVLYRMIGATPHYFTPSGCWNSSVYAARRFLTRSRAEQMQRELAAQFGRVEIEQS
jgi:hypothetical protein